ncbi:endogenous retrovirus group PABLB member 1 Env polyprotein-like [Alligator sinensis]|uniref:Endogenous retrovirus group PABLB member 1 Env polyprotein-like n=1 Tax=Alligator sinensis TaxID=38654 RepID=A0A3Q0HB27_ALLSI|nr:endogenous retrovirus group PABLB member 1 Env polyprotein-like [Alligator sinensis]
MFDPKHQENKCRGFWTNYTFAKRPPPSSDPATFPYIIQIAKPIPGFLCYKYNGANKVSFNTYNYTIDCTSTNASIHFKIKEHKNISFNCLASAPTIVLNKTHAQHRKWIAYNGTYYICENCAYFWLPGHWSGSCYLGYITPAIRHLSLPPSKSICTAREKREITEDERFGAIMFPIYGIGRTIQKIRLLANILKQVNNDTAESLDHLTQEMIALRTMVLQNRIALDFTLASKGGICALIGKECYTYIPDKSEEIHDLVDHIRKTTTKLHESNTWSFSSWFGSLFGSLRSTVIHGLLILFVIILLICIIYLCFRCCLFCLSQPSPAIHNVMTLQMIQQEQESRPTEDKYKKLQDFFWDLINIRA